MRPPVVNRDLLIPRRYRGRTQAGLAGLGDVIDQFTQAIMDASDAYAYLNGAKDAVTATNSPKLISLWQSLIIRGQELRTRAGTINTSPSVGGFIENLFGSFAIPSNIPVIGTIDRLGASDMAVYTADAQQFLADVSNLKLLIQQYNALIQSGINPSDATKAIEQQQTGFFSSLTSAIAAPAIGIGLIALVAAAIIFAPELKAGFHAIKGKIKK